MTTRPHADFFKRLTGSSQPSTPIRTPLRTPLKTSSAGAALTGLGLKALLALAFSIGFVASAQAQDAVLASKDAESLFTSADPKLHANKQVAYGIIRDLLEAGHWSRADQYLTERYIQHNPNAASGRAAVVDYFVGVRKVQPQPVPGRIKTPIVAVMAEGDLVTVLYPRVVQDPKRPGQSYTTTWFDTWRIQDGKADEHWDPALKGESPDLSVKP